jgi:hypothetical protein
MLELGVHHRSARALLDRHETTRVADYVAHLKLKLESGWIPRESPAAWLMAALRDGYTLPASDEVVARGLRRPSRQEVEAEERRESEKAWEERHARLERLGVDEATDEVWRAVQADLREAGQWSPVLAACVLRKGGRGAYELLVPWEGLRATAEAKLGAIGEALDARSGRRYALSMKLER